MKFFVGWHQPNKGLSGTYLFSRRKIPIFISIRRLWKDGKRIRKKRFPAHSWILDSGAFKELEIHGRYTFTLQQYANEIIYWWTPTMLAAVTPDFMCGAYIFDQRHQHTGIRYSIKSHQKMTVCHYRALRKLLPDYIYLMPVLQGSAPQEYLDCIGIYGDILKPGMWVGVGSLAQCQTNQIENVLTAIKSARPDLELHGFGIKKKSFFESDITIKLLYSADSQAHNFVGRRNKITSKFHSGNNPANAITYYHSLIHHINTIDNS